MTLLTWQEMNVSLDLLDLTWPSLTSGEYNSRCYGFVATNWEDMHDGNVQLSLLWALHSTCKSRCIPFNAAASGSKFSIFVVSSSSIHISMW